MPAVTRFRQRGDPNTGRLRAISAERQSQLIPHRSGQQSSYQPKVDRAGLAAATCFQFIGHGCPVLQGLQAGALNGRDVDEDILRAAFRLNEAKAFVRIELLDRSSGHFILQDDF